MNDYPASSVSSSPPRPSTSAPPKGSLTKILTIPGSSSPALPSNFVNQNDGPNSTNGGPILNAGSNADSGITSVAISPDSRYVAAGSLDTIVRIWDVTTGQLVEQLRGHRDSVYSVAFTQDGKGLVSGSLDRTLKGWDVSAVVAGAMKGKGPGSEGKLGVSPCTMDFVGHKVCVLSFECRTLPHRQ
jgi:WD40 repeat protein